MDNEIRKVIAQACLKHHDTCETSNDMKARRIMQALTDNGYIISKMAKPINLSIPLNEPPYHWSQLSDIKYTKILNAIKVLEPFETNDSFHIHEELYLVNGNKYQVLSAISDDPKSPDYQPNISVYTTSWNELGICVEKGCCKGATQDYNGHKHYVCDSCYEHLNNEFEEDYK